MKAISINIITNLKRFTSSSGGFTLVELLVVVAILGILSAIAMPSLTGLTATARTNAAKAELGSVQTAMDAMMADKSLSSIAAAGPFATFNDKPAEGALSPKYLRQSSTSYSYSWTTYGSVTQTNPP